jgi:fructokinase
MNDGKTIVGLGELLWDLLPAGERLGGAPANFAVMAARLGNRGVIASRLGADERGERARTALNALPVDSVHLQFDLKQPTGTVGIEIAGNEPHYVIHAPAAWDFLEWTAEWSALAAETNAVCFGTLAQRERVSRVTIQEFLRATRPECVRVFDVNLRAPFFSANVIAASLPLATILKLNEVEVPIVQQLLDAPAESDLVRAARWLLDRYPLQLVAITLGAHGSLLVTRDAADRHPGMAVKVVDTVGAGDAFTAALVDAYLRGATPAAINEAGNRWGAWVASQPGAMPDIDAASPAAVSGKTVTHL